MVIRHDLLLAGAGAGTANLGRSRGWARCNGCCQWCSDCVAL